MNIVTCDRGAVVGEHRLVGGCEKAVLPQLIRTAEQEIARHIFSF